MYVIKYQKKCVCCVRYAVHYNVQYVCTYVYTVIPADSSSSS